MPKIIIFPLTVLPKAGPEADNPARTGWGHKLPHAFSDANMHSL